MALASVLAFALESTWVVPIVGGTCFIAAVWLGWRLLAAGRSGAPAAEDVPLKDFLDGVTQDRRAAPRRKGNTVEVELSHEGGPALTGYVLDRSQGGLRVVVEKPVSEGNGWKIRPVNAETTTPWTEVSIRSCRREGIHYHLGCQFDRMPNWSLMLQFG